MDGKGWEGGATHLLLAAIDLPFFLIGQSEHGLPVLIRQVQFILQWQERFMIPHSFKKMSHLSMTINLKWKRTKHFCSGCRSLSASLLPNWELISADYRAAFWYSPCCSSQFFSLVQGASCTFWNAYEPRKWVSVCHGEKVKSWKREMDKSELKKEGCNAGGRGRCWLKEKKGSYSMWSWKWISTKKQKWGWDAMVLQLCVKAHSNLIIMVLLPWRQPEVQGPPGPPRVKMATRARGGAP